MNGYADLQPSIPLISLVGSSSVPFSYTQNNPARRFQVKDDEQTFGRFSLFIPYSELHFSQGQHNLKFYLAVQDAAGGGPLAASDWVYFWHAE